MPIINNNQEIEFTKIKRTPLYFGSEDKPLLGWLHTSNSHNNSQTGLILCQPLAIEYMNAYRSMRYVADYFALAGIPTIRFDYHGTGDSVGIEEDKDRLDDWIWSIKQAASTLKEITKCVNLGLFGFRMGATLATLFAEHEEVDFLVLWAALNNGKKYIREIKLLQMTNKIQPSDSSSNLLEAGGMGYWPQTKTSIEKINLTTITPKSKNILIIPRDEQISDTELYDDWQNKGLNVEKENFIGSSLMLVDSHFTEVPHETIQSIVNWVDSKNKGDFAPSEIKLEQPKSTSTFYHRNINYQNEPRYKEKITEKIFYYGESSRNFAILTEPKKVQNTQLPTILISNAGANHRVGPSRLYTLIARELGLLGFTCLRLDVPGIGDSISPSLKNENIEYIESPSTHLKNIADKLMSDNDSSEFIFMGLCSGAYFSFHAALELDELDISEAILINPLTFYWEQGTTIENSPTKGFSNWNWYKLALTKPTSWIKLAKGNIDFKSLYMAIKNRITTKLKLNFLPSFTQKQNNFDMHKQQLAMDLTKITDRNIHLQFVLARNDPGYDILTTNAGRKLSKLRKQNKINIEFIENADHTFSKYKPRQDVIDFIINHFKEKLV